MEKTSSRLIISKVSTKKVKERFLQKIEDTKKLLKDQLFYIGEQAVKIARERGSYQDRTGNLRSSIGYCIIEDGEIVLRGKNERFSGMNGDGSEGASASEKLLAKLQSEFPQGLVLIVCAGMNYASYVEDVHHYDVLTSAQLKAESLADKLLNSILE